MFQEAIALRGITHFTSVKGLEGSCDLPRERTAIIGLGAPTIGFERLTLHPRDYSFEGRNVALDATPTLVEAMLTVLAGQPSELMQSTLWNGGFYLWRCGSCRSLEAGIQEAKRLLTEGLALQKLRDLQQVATPLQLTH
jgi:anthranilate phosphoribosyltransferase